MNHLQINQWTSTNDPIRVDTTATEAARALTVGTGEYDAAWTSIVGPTAMSIARHLGFKLRSAPSIDVTVPELAELLGVRPHRIRTAIGRLLMYGLMVPAPGDRAVSLLVRAAPPSGNTVRRSAARRSADNAA